MIDSFLVISMSMTLSFVFVLLLVNNLKYTVQFCQNLALAYSENGKNCVTFHLCNSAVCNQCYSAVSLRRFI